MNKHMGFLPWTVGAVGLALAMSGCSKPPEPSVAVSVDSAASAALPASAAVGQVADGDVTEHVKTAFNQSESLKGFDIGVVTVKGDVRLTGMLDSQAQIDDAVRIARATEGAHTIHDELTIRK
jgi:osmotically-inducible protein OsmY